VKVDCPMWIYWVPPDEDEEAAEDEELAEATVWLALDQEQVPGEARPLEGYVDCPGTLVGCVTLDGASLGPFMLPPTEQDTPSASRPSSAATAATLPAEPTEAQQGTDTAGADTRCRLAGLQFRINPPSGYSYRAKDPSPLAERVEELGGCEAQRLLTGCPVVVGFLKAAGQAS